MLFWAFFLLWPFILLGAALLLPLLKAFRLLPAGVPTGLVWLTLSSLMFGALTIVLLTISLVVDPARLQDRFLGARHATIFALRSYDEWGFQDPGREWRYALDPASKADLARRCTPDRRPAAGRCTLHSEMDDRYYASAALDGNMLVIEEGLH